MSDEMPDPFQCLRDSVDHGFNRVLAELQRFHEALEHRLDRRANRIDAELHTILLALGKVIHMGETTDQAISELTALAQANSAALAKLKTDVAAALAAIQSSGTLNANQQAEVDALKASMSADAATIGEIDASTQPVAPPAP